MNKSTSAIVNTLDLLFMILSERKMSIYGKHSNASMAATRYETVMAVRATAFDLPESLRLSAIALIDDIYGPESDEPGSFFCTNDFREFIVSDEYQQYIKENCPDGVDLDVDQLNYCEAKREELFSRLDEIFSAYIRRT